MTWVEQEEQGEGLGTQEGQDHEKVGSLDELRDELSEGPLGLLAQSRKWGIA